MKLTAPGDCRWPHFLTLILLIIVGSPATQASTDPVDQALQRAENLLDTDPVGALDALEQIEPLTGMQQVRHAVVQSRAQIFVGQAQAGYDTLMQVEDASADVDPAVESAWLKTLATAAFALGRLEEALQAGRRAIDLLDPKAQTSDYAEALTVAIQVALGASEYEEALNYAAQLQDTLAEVPVESVVRRDAQLIFGVLYLEFGEPEASRAAYREAVEMSLELGDKLAEADARYALARLLIDDQRLAEAAEELDRLRRIYQASDDAFGQAMVMLERARLALLQKEFPAADRLSAAAIDRLDQLSVPSLARAAYFVKAEAKLELGQAQEARRLLDQVLKASNGSPLPRIRYALGARVAAALGDWEAAYEDSRAEVEMLDQAVEERLSRASDQARARLELATDRVRRAELEAELELQAVRIEAADRQARLQRTALVLAAALLVFGGFFVYRLLRQGRQLTNLAMRDALTQLPNRRSFLNQAERELKEARLRATSTGLLMLDLDHFKRINDRFGHDIGDEVLVDFADILRQASRTSDFPARLGGEEFAVLLPKTDADGAKRVAERLLTGLASSLPLAEGRVERLTASVGVVSSGPDRSLETLMKAADDALYQAKHEGRARAVQASLTGGQA